ncbi:ATP-binding cassette [Coprinopsis cinerea okayama7|uniref:ATP-binding cassette n=1 Tax=Coprinopsis cinerea (strain Okayama-7 / 130 / ATCC MYA-4618 / FGSC 9003) TaxID=240176 RepID=D6RQQ0_COPC7|nr:ATP-binding cassette [Coprinopsis cinerea okayama7\|eukprot:XP_002910181.1 ATP-binding cassette [Coprinopsis cinerea okayama7\
MYAEHLDGSTPLTNGGCGQVVVGGTVAYVPQIPWIQNATVRENVIFGQPDNETRFQEMIKACSLTHDLAVLPHRELTEIGEKGINLSGGQKARISLARAAYSQSDIVLLDDPLSAVDAHVGNSILENCILKGPLAERTRILVTHSLQVLDKLDYIYVLDNGTVIEQGTYTELVANGPVFSRLVEEYGQKSAFTSTGSNLNERAELTSVQIKDDLPEVAKEALMQAEERNIGAVSWDVYKRYLWYAGGMIWLFILLSILILNQAAAVGDNLWLGFWTSLEFPSLSQGDYMAVYAAFGAAQAILTFCLSFAFALISLRAGLKLFKAALRAILRSPLSFFDTTPMGRIVSRLSKDQNILDNELSPTMYSFFLIFASMFGVVGLVFYTFPYLGISFAPIGVFYYVMFSYYRRTSIETKRLEAILRSTLYAAISESLTGLSTIRAYAMGETATRRVDHGNDLQNRAYYMTISTQRWLAIRLDVFANLLVLGIGLFGSGFRKTVNPAMVGVVLSNTLALTTIFAEMVSQFAQNEQNMNSAERLMHYADLPPEAALTTENDPPTSWPQNGEIKFEKVQMAYREGLPLVLKDVSLKVNPQEKVGVVGRTGAGKSSLLHALFRTVELSGGKIEIDGVDISTIGLETLRTRLALVPQDCTLFLGTLRENLDPHGQRTDAELISVLQRASLLPPDGVSDPVAEAKFSLDAVVGNEGSNMSAGEKQLIALCRALVRNSRIIILDEATSSVDVETDSKLQQTIQREFASSTLLCIAHRLNTIGMMSFFTPGFGYLITRTNSAYYDRILVMDEGRVAEFDTVLNLYDKEGSIFRALCDEANLSRADILKIRGEHEDMKSESR